METAGATGWLSYHLYYHQDLERAVLRFVRPLSGKLLAEGWIDNFFFVRYHLGGPHIRLRLQPRPASAASVAAAAEAAARDFLTDQPSTSPFSLERIRRIHAVVLASDPHEHDETIYPDNSFLAVPFRPEIERYGGPDLVQSSLDFFTISSLTALDLLALYAEQKRSRRLAVAFQGLACQALSFARGAEDLAVLLRYGLDQWGDSAPHAIAQAERVFAQQQSTFDRLFRREMERLEATSPDCPEPFDAILDRLGGAARRLSQSLRTADLATHQRIGGSQLHMMSNRLGLSNTEEVYLGRLLALAALAVVELFPGA